MERRLAGIGVPPHAAAALATAASRPAGIVVLCGSSGAGKTTLAELILSAHPRPAVAWFGDLRMPDEVAAALARAANESVLAVVRSGESHGLRARWSDMGLASSLVDRASVVTVTLRRLARAHPTALPLPDLLVLEILAADGAFLTGSLDAEAHALVAAGLTTTAEALRNIPD